MPTDLVTIPNIDLISTGTWEASTGTVTFSEDNLASILASQDDPTVKEPRLIIGHTPPAAPGSFSGQDGFFGEQPTIGKFTNLRLGDNGQTIYADLVGVPAWLADILPTAYPNRSVEVYWNVTTASGKEWDAVMPRVAVLGINLPAVATLEDLAAMYSAEGPDGVELVKVGERVAASRGDMMPQRTAASTQVEDVRRAFYEDFAQDDRYWWWIKGMFLNPSLLIVDDDDGGLWALPYTVKADGAEFGDPVEVFTQYVEKDSGKVAASKAPATEAFLIGAQTIYKSAAESRPKDHNQPPKEATKMAIDLAVLRTRLGLTTDQLPDDATEDQINEVLANTGTGNPDAPAVVAPGTPDPADNVATPATNAPDQPGAATGPGPAGGAQLQGTTVDPAAFAQLQEDARLGREARTTQLSQDRNAYIDAAVRKGKFPPSSKASYLAQLEQGGAVEKATREFIDKLAENVVPVAEAGSAGDPDAAGGDVSTYPNDWLSPAERARVDKASAAGVGVVEPGMIIREA